MFFFCCAHFYGFQLIHRLFHQPYVTFWNPLFAHNYIEKIPIDFRVTQHFIIEFQGKKK